MYPFGKLAYYHMQVHIDGNFYIHMHKYSCTLGYLTLRLSWYQIDLRIKLTQFQLEFVLGII